MLKFKSISAKNPNKSGNSKDSSTPTIAWISTDELNEKFDQEKSSRFSKLRFGNKKNSKKNAKTINGGLSNELHLLKDAFSKILPRSMGNGLDRIASDNELKRSKRKSISNIDVKEKCNKMEESLVTDLSDLELDLGVKNSENNKSAIITVISSEESLDDANIQIRTVKKPKEKTKEKKSKLQVEISEVKYFKDDTNDAKMLKSGNDFPWTFISYDPDVNDNKIGDDFLNLYQLINVLSHPIYQNKAILIDLRNYDQYQSGTILGATHSSEFHNKSGQFSIRKIKDLNYSIVILLYSHKEIDQADLKFDGHLQIFKIKYDSELKQKTISLFNNILEKPSKIIPSFTCFDFGCILLSENFEQSLKWLSRLNIDAIVTDKEDKLCQRISAVPGSRRCTIISITSNDVGSGDYSDKNICESKLMSVLHQLSNNFSDDCRIFLVFEDPDCLPFSLLALILMYKNHWSLQDSISCIKYIRCQKFNSKHVYLNILKNFEKLFFGKRSYSGGHKSKIVKEFALDL